MTPNKHLPIFPDSYVGQKAEDYDQQGWMERNQKKSTLRCLEYLYDKKLGELVENSENPLILDLGCGTGFSSEIFVENGFRVIGIEILNDMLAHAISKRRHLDSYFFELILANINYLPIRQHSINHVFSISAYNFITHHAETEREKRKIANNTAKYLRQVLRESARIIIEFYPENDQELEIFTSSFIKNGFDGFSVKNNPNQKGGQTFLLMKKKED